ncbi:MULTISPECIES: DUF1775 domain-containing protein [unclassified Streptomyces]|uniref:DUF1775 domain-containing protein n=1 Tax=unclassified Streptomyces TaxID=2593676 RepID=UPI000DD9F7B3|nr:MULTISPECIES: DUF1775 domain-containing protein [unclassified Streptomyces]QZZ30803.1 DUF1775 domain-containing protein [Streptomyces sp. ST1015]
MLKKTLTTLTATTLILLTAQSAAAHVEVSADNPQALAQNVELTWSAESESATAGIKEVRVVLPKGIAPADVTYVSGPKSWTLTATSDGFAVKGAPLPTGEDAEVSVTVKQLPDAEQLVFKTLQTYGDGKIDRWIELEEPGKAAEEEPGHSHSGNPAPVLKLKAAALPQPTPTPTAPATTPAPESKPTPSASPVAAEKEDKGGMSGATWSIIGIAIAGVLAVTYAAVRRRNQASE